MAANRSSPVHEATLQANWLLQRIGRELRAARIAAGLTQQQVSNRIGSSKAYVCRTEAGSVSRLPMPVVARHAAAVGMRLYVQLYPGVRRVLDAPQLGLLGRLRVRLRAAWTWELEVPMPEPRDLRAVDARLTRGDCTIVVEAITRLADVQAQLRAAQRKKRDLGATRLLLLIAGSHANRRALAAAAPILHEALLTGTRDLIRQLQRGHDPGGDMLIVL
jgi:transcriptional regulator with XRE-family HTH domain